MGKHPEIEPNRKVAGIFGPIWFGELSLPLKAREWQKDTLLSKLFQTCITLQTSLDRRFLRFGMTVQEASVLIRCVESGKITPGRLAVAIGRDKGAVTRYTNRLELSHLLAREMDQHDRRICLLKPTAEGKRVAQELASVFFSIREKLFAGMLESDLRRLTGVLERLHENAVRIGSKKKCDAVR